jgi:hypothetical protein
MARKTALRAALLRAVSDILIRLSRRPPAEPPPPETVSDDRWEVRVEVRVRLGQAGTAQAGDGQPDGQLVGGETAELIRQALRGGEALKVTTLSRRCGKDPPTSHFRAVIYRMVRAGELERRPGYRYALASGQGS